MNAKRFSVKRYLRPVLIAVLFLFASFVAFTLSGETSDIVAEALFQAAREHYVKGDYQLCLSDLHKLKKICVEYENSGDLQSFCEQGLRLASLESTLKRSGGGTEDVEPPPLPPPPPPGPPPSFEEKCKLQ